MKIDVFKITSNDLRSGKYKDFIPEFYELKKVVENSLWHEKQNVFDHTVLVFEELLKILELNFLTINKVGIIKNYLEEKVDRKSKRELLIIGTLLHDIGKRDTLVINKDSTALCPLHELVGSKRVGLFSKRFNLSKKEEEFLREFVLYHGFAHDIRDLIIKTKDYKKYSQIFRETIGKIGIELLLFIYADMKGSDLEKSAKNEFIDREKLLIKMINEYE